jgi:hypothetical protein
VWLQEEAKDERLVKPKERSCYNKYILIKPDTRFYIFSKIVFMFVTLVSFVLIPYVTLVKRNELPSPYLEIIVTLDVFWILHMI